MEESENVDLTERVKPIEFLQVLRNLFKEVGTIHGEMQSNKIE